MTTMFVSPAYFDFKLEKHFSSFIGKPALFKDLKNDSNHEFKRHTIHVNTESISTPKIIAIERKKCSERCEVTCARRLIPETVNSSKSTCARRLIPENVNSNKLTCAPETVNHSTEKDIEHEQENVDFLDSNFKPDVKSKINFFNQIASKNSRYSRASPKRRLSGRKASKSSFQRPKSECKDYRISKFSLERRDSKKGLTESDGIVKESKQKFQQNKGTKNKPIQLPFTAVPVKFRIAAFERKCLN